MPNIINIPTPLRPFTDKKESVEVSGATVGELLTDLTTRYEGLRRHLYADNGRLRNFVNVYLNDEDIRYLQREETPVKAGDTLSIVPSVAGGASAVGEGDGGPTEAARARRAASELRRRGDGRTSDPPGSRFVAGRDQALQPAPDHAGGRHRRSAEAETVERALHRRRRPGFAGSDVPRGCRRRPHRGRRLRRRRLQQPAAAAAAWNAGRRAIEAGLGQGSDQRAQSARAGGHVRDGAVVAERARVVRALRRDPRRDRQLPDALPGERRVRHPREAERRTAASSGSRARRQCSRRRMGRATAASIPSLLRPAWCRVARRAACSACCLASSASSRRRKRSS